MRKSIIFNVSNRYYGLTGTDHSASDFRVDYCNFTVKYLFKVLNTPNILVTKVNMGVDTIIDGHLNSLFYYH